MFLVSSLIHTDQHIRYDLLIVRVQHLSKVQSTSLQGVRDVIAVDELFDAVPAINRSFHHVKVNAFSGFIGLYFNIFDNMQNVAKSDNPHGDDYIQWPEFRLFLQTLRQFFEYYEAFNRYQSFCGNNKYLVKLNASRLDNF